jgi:Tripartite tricarboxylate transporter family receptor
MLARRPTIRRTLFEWAALFAPQGTPRDIINKLNAAVVEALADPVVRSRLTEFGGEIFPREQQTPQALAAMQKADAEKWLANYEGGRHQGGMSRGHDTCNPTLQGIAASGQNEPSKHVRSGGSFVRKRPWRPHSQDRAECCPSQGEAGWPRAALEAGQHAFWGFRIAPPFQLTSGAATGACAAPASRSDSEPGSFPTDPPTRYPRRP